VSLVIVTLYTQLLEFSKRANAIGFAIPQSLFLREDEVAQ
jgi:hypothetical protein